MVSRCAFVGTTVVNRKGVFLSWAYLSTGLLFGGGALGQVANDRLTNDILGGGVNELQLSLAAGTRADSDVLLPGTDKAISLLELAVIAKNDRAAGLLLDVGAKIDSLEGRFGSASILEVFAQQGMLRALSAYIDQDTSVLYQSGTDSLIAAIASGQTPAAELLLDRMSNVVPRDQLQASLDEALIFAARRNDSESTKLLLARGADTSSGLPLIAAVANCSPDSVRDLLPSYEGAPLPSYENEQVAKYASRCFRTESDEDEAIANFSQIAQLLYEADDSVCPLFLSAQGEELVKVSLALANLGLCQ